MAASVESRRSSSVRAKDNNFAIFEDQDADADSPEPLTFAAKPETFVDDLVKSTRSQRVENEVDLFHNSSYDVPPGTEEFENSEEDPFSETDDDEHDDDALDEYEDHSLIEEQNGFIGNAPVYQVSHSYDRSFSTTTAIHLEDPDHEYPVVRKSESRGRSLGEYMHNLDGIDEDGPLRNVSETVSVMPDEYEFSGQRFPNDIQERTPLSQSGRYNRISDQFSPPPERKRTSRSPTKDRLMSSAHSTRHGSGFRNTSSVKNMQLSSPSPTPFSSPPRSASKRYGTTISPTRQYTPSRRSSVMSSPPRHHPEPQKEYPLVLLHCSISGASIPYSQAALDNALPPNVVGNIGLLREKLSPTVIERGILVPHPGDDYELLEERVLESLELKRPRLGKCGHFNSQAHTSNGVHGRESSDDAKKAAAEGHDQGPEHFDGAAACPDCGGHTCSEICESGCESDRRWNVKVYAANGLMRAGAWTAAWREMEKVDVEVGVFIPERYKRELDMYANHEAKEAYEKVPENPILSHTRNISQAKTATEVNSAPIPMSRQRSTSASATESASTAACARRTSRQKSESATKLQSKTGSKDDQLPLSVLLERYVRRTFSNRPDFLIGIVILVIGLWFTGRGQTMPNAPNIAVNEDRVSTETASMPLSSAAIPSMASIVSDMIPSSASVPPMEPPSSSNGLPACTFAVSEASLHGMTAVPSDMAMKILEESATSSPQPSTSQQAGPRQAEPEPESSDTVEIVNQSHSTPVESQTNKEVAEPQHTEDAAEDETLIEKVEQVAEEGDETVD